MATVDYALNLSEIRDFLIDVAHKAGSMITGADRPKAGGTGTKLNCRYLSASVKIVQPRDECHKSLVDNDSCCKISSLPYRLKSPVLAFQFYLPISCFRTLQMKGFK